MNIFITDESYAISAQNLDDVRLRCQIKELAQILSTAIYNKIGVQSDIYKPYNPNGRFTKWADNYYNMRKLIYYGDALELEHIFRFNKSHKSYQIIKNCEKYINNFDINYIKQYSFVADEQTEKHMLSGINIYQAYQKTLQDKWYNDKRTPKWTNRQEPSFYIGNKNLTEEN